jgi:hypothetical protein
MTASEHAVPPTSSRQKLERILLFLLLVIIMFTFPNRPSFDLDASWRMALGKFFLDHLQFGKDVVFTYGPLGFLMGKTYSGLLFWSLIAWQLFACCSIAYLIMYWGQRLAAGWPRIFYYGFFLLFGVCYEDALHMLVIALIGFELLRREQQPWHWTTPLFLLFLSIQSVAKFTNLMLAAVMVGTVAALALWHRRPRTALGLIGWFGGGFLAGWCLCGQNPLNLPIYLLNSWYVSQGYQEVMGIATPDGPFWKALVVIAVLLGYLILNLFTQKDRPQAIAAALMLGALIYLNWKHGFVRADGHMVGFFYCALLPVVAYPVLLQDPPSFPRLKRWALAIAGLLCVFGISDTLPALVHSALAIFQNRLWSNVSQVMRINQVHGDYAGQLFQEQQRYDMPRTRAVVGDHTIDVLGYDQAVAVYNQFNYHPRPVFQSYSVYTPELAKLNADFYRSSRAPDFVLLKIHSIDERLPVMDDSAVLYLVSQCYRYVLSEKSFQLWQKIGPPLSAEATPRVLEHKTMTFEQVWTLKYGEQPLWLRIDVRPSLLGRLRTFFYKPPMLRLVIVDTNGKSTTYRMPAPIGRAGFIVSPVIDDLMDYTHFANTSSPRFASQIMLTLQEPDRKYFAPAAEAEVSAIMSSNNSHDFFTQQNRERFYMFKTAPISYEANNQPSNEQLAGAEVMVMHAPSEMTFEFPAGATEANGRFGILDGAYQNGNRTNGAEFVVVWSDGKESKEIFRQFLDPLNKPADRGLHSFHVDLSRFSGGRLYFRTLPGPYNDFGWDWTAWTGVEIK